MAAISLEAAGSGDRAIGLVGGCAHISGLVLSRWVRRAGYRRRLVVDSGSTGSEGVSFSADKLYK